MATPGFYVGVKGGYDDMQVYTDNNIDGLTGVDLTKDKYFINIHGGYLFPITPDFTLGPQISLSYCSKYSLKVEGIGSNDNKFYSVNLFAVGQYTFKQFYVEGRLGGVAVVKNESGAINGVEIADGSNDTEYNFAAGAGVGYYFTPNLSAGITYDHIFGKNYNSQTAVATEKYNSVPTMDSIGAQITYHF